MKRLLCVLLALALFCLLFGCAKEEAPQAPGEPAANETPNEALHHIEIDVKDYGVIKAELDASAAPLTVANFLKLAGEGFYDGLTFHRIIDGFMIQGGDPTGTGMGGAEENVKGEFQANGVDNPISHTRGVLSMARNAIDMDSASSQFFIVHEDNTFLDGQYAGFGRVTDGMEVVDALCEGTPVQDGNGTVAPADQPVIVSVKVID